MSKKTFYWLVAIAIILLLAKNIIGIDLDSDSNRKNLKPQTTDLFNSTMIGQQSRIQDRGSIHSAMQKNTIVNTMALPWDGNSNSSGSVASQSLPGLMGAHHYQPDSIGGGSSQYRALLETFTSGILITESGSSFVCPNNLPYAVSYQLTNPVAYSFQGASESPVIYGRGYINDCMLQKKYDLLYGSDQHTDGHGSAEQLTAFIPGYLPEGCNSGLSAKQPVIFKASALTIESPIYYTPPNGGNPQVVGYTQHTTVTSDCNIICNAMLDYYCNAESSMGYCYEEVLNSYYINSIYKARNIHEYFCSCKIYNVAWGNVNWAFTNAVDIESAVKYNNPLKSVTCSNLPPN